uniref:Uncharacterized protein n=1 Tax=Plectus sambesii TaxID=2011161 RepID=A0A914VTE3_9BILA
MATKQQGRLDWSGAGDEAQWSRTFSSAPAFPKVAFVANNKCKWITRPAARSMQLDCFSAPSFAIAAGQWGAARSFISKKMHTMNQIHDRSFILPLCLVVAQPLWSTRRSIFLPRDLFPPTDFHLYENVA